MSQKKKNLRAECILLFQITEERGCYSLSYDINISTVLPAGTEPDHNKNKFMLVSSVACVTLRLSKCKLESV